MNPKDTKDFDLQYHFLNLPIAMFNPYIIAYTSFPFDRGTLDFNGDWHVQNANIKSNNHILIIDPRVNKRLIKKNKKWLPIRLILAFIRERGNVIDYEIPITGTLNKPKFDWRNAKRDLIRNILVKPPTTPYGIEVKKVENEIEKLLTLKWEMSQSSLQRKQQRFVRKMVAFLKENPTATISVYPQHYTTKEKEYLLFFEAKKKYFFAIKNRKTNTFCKLDSIAIEEMPIKEDCFVRYLNKHTKGKMLFTIQDKCAQFVNTATINAKFEQLKTVRADAFMAFFKKKNVNKQIKIHAGKDDIPYNGFSYYKIEYHGTAPKSLTKALADMKTLNDEAPRKKFKNERKGTGKNE
jgi:hypothetical protein